MLIAYPDLSGRVGFSSRRVWVCAGGMSSESESEKVSGKDGPVCTGVECVFCVWGEIFHTNEEDGNEESSEQGCAEPKLIKKASIQEGS